MTAVPESTHEEMDARAEAAVAEVRRLLLEANAAGGSWVVEGCLRERLFLGSGAEIGRVISIRVFLPLAPLDGESRSP